MKNTKKTTTAQDWLEMDLKAQSGAIWTDQTSKDKPLHKEKQYSNPENNPTILKPDSIKYGSFEIQSNSQVIE